MRATKHPLPRMLYFIALLTATGCSDRSLGPPVSTVSDSAGVRIVTSQGPNGVGPLAWSLSDHPLLSIGVIEGPPEYAFSGVLGVALLRNGNVAVLDGATQTLRFFAPSGQYLYSSGGQGEGPGEFGRALRMWRLRSDSLVVLDSGSRKLSVFSPEGRYSRSFPLPESEVGGPAWPSLITQDGSILATSYYDGFQSGLEQALFVDTIRLEVAGFSERPARVIVTYPFQRWALPWGRRVARIDLPFTTRVPHALAGDRVAVANPQAFEIALDRSSSDDRELWRWSRDLDPIRDSQIDSLRIHETGRFPSGDPRASSLKEFLNKVPLPRFNSPVRALMVDELSYLWARIGPRTWDVFTPGGIWHQVIEFPESIDIHQITTREIIGVVRDRVDVEFIRVFGLNRSQG